MDVEYFEKAAMKIAYLDKVCKAFKVQKLKPTLLFLSPNSSAVLVSRLSFLPSPSLKDQRLFQSLLFEACGRTVNPVNGAVGLLWTGNWLACQSAVETVLSGGVLRPSPEFSGLDQFDERSEANNVDLYGSQDLNERLKRKGLDNMMNDLDLGLQAGFPARMTAGGSVKRRTERLASPPSDESETTTLESGLMHHQELHNHNGQESKLLRLFF
ncbi:LOB domain-containing protein 39 [Abeliophyllum distichum]|uniref:LOB domain-containing protein 39 n=1 Tax=Abeliophyllum distichum TaxID=126358 RepID=A0ABD1NRY2_9LAMI